MQGQPPSKMTRIELDKKRKAELVALNNEKFGVVTIGIHGSELPKFSQTSHSKSWWKLQQDKSEEEPVYKSQALLK